MEQKILIPDIGDYSNVEIIEVAIKDGGQLKKDDTMVTLETDKATMDIPAPFDLKIIQVLIKPGDRVSQGTVIANAVSIVDVLEKPTLKANDLNEESTLKANNLSDNPTLKTNKPGDVNNVDKEELPYSKGVSGIHNANPAVRKLARELGVNLDNVVGSSQHGRIVEHDVKSYVNQLLLNNNFNCQKINANNISIDFSKWGPIKEQALSRIKKKSGQSLHKNWISIPHVTHFDTADITELENFRKRLISSHNTDPSIDPIKKSSINPPVKITLLTFLIKATVSALQKFPHFNSSLSVTGEVLILKNYYNIGIAVNTESGLVVPVIKNADQKDIFTLAQELSIISKKAKENKLVADDLQGGCFTISSLGGIAGNNFTPIINAPEVAILGVSKHKITPEFINQELQPRLILPLSLSYDHRVIDGVEAAWFCNYLIQELENIKNFYV